MAKVTVQVPVTTVSGEDLLGTATVERDGNKIHVELDIKGQAGAEVSEFLQQGDLIGLSFAILKKEAKPK